MMAYDSLSTHKGMGGLNFTGLRLFNITLLGRQVWQLINNKDTLCYHVLCSNYGMTARFKFDKWGFEGLDGNSLRTFFNGIWDSLVSDLWRSNSREWDRDRVEELYGDGFGDETIIHALRDYPKARAILFFGGIDKLFLDSSYNVWNGRNSTLFQGKEDDAQLVWEQARTLGDDFKIFNLLHALMNLRLLRSHRWIKPPNDAIKINVDD
ncbi:hypothetical protein Godav_014812 [Gossypium davidsonii]|uniref:Uncharacterized protein n=2 Tax=Gossypium TaxID=3633 RepID=A0A7J8RL87_GOSDV|nr:hypothetical protein [Gossypium davidsonii]MBA0649771.1 hypothetical protein [Gossypium klotzschianum]